MISRVQGVEIGSQNRSKIDQKLKPKMDRLLASILMDYGRFWEASWGGKSSQERTKIQFENASKK